MKKRSIMFLVLIAAVFVGGFVLPSFEVLAQDPSTPKEYFEGALKEAGLITDVGKAPTVEDTVGNIIRSVLTYIGVVILVLIIYAGGLWATARGNEDQIKKAKSILVGSVIGLIIIFSAGIIANFVIKAIGGAI